ncbi:uncharacterized protein Dwil_GK13029 [Drosophila willistoni]|uniref:Osiris 1 n=1 Tax=Drosophila willistoni TaxID=7260 RepID=B4NHE3_DROWI|nr:uncharacterized protein LOC6650296 [Drosophila willistoni]XP_046868439.1 uncharacterized protein LOC124460887 [Drosophila willistoni]EDW84619.1 uncharacterized protein Dwil_GK13029 [Drosophila willistoni]
MLMCRIFVAALLLLLLLHYSSATEEQQAQTETTIRAIKTDAQTKSPFTGRARGSLVTHNDVYIARNQRQCFDTRNLVSCIKYKASKLIWKLATNSMGFFPNEYGREMNEDKHRLLRLVQLGEPADDIVVFNDAKSLEGDSELTRIYKFLKRAMETFGRNHGLQLAISSETGARVMDESESRGARKKKKWLIILPLIILMKIAHLKMTLVSLLFGVLGMNALLVGGVGWLIHYLKFKTLCKIHPHLVQTHSHVYDSDPSDYSQFLGSNSYTPYSSGPHEINANGYSKDWATSKAYTGYNYLDTISKRLQ